MSITNDPPPEGPSAAVSATPSSSPVTRATTASIAEPAPTGWASLKSLNGYQWFVFIVCCLAWDMDCMDQQLFVLARRPAMSDLVAPVKEDDPRISEFRTRMTAQAEKDGKKAPTDAEVVASIQSADVNDAGTFATSFFMLGWAIGGIGFGIAGDRLGRVKTLMLTILLYSLFTGLNSFSRSPTDFYVFRLLTGMGVGGAFAAAVTLLADTMPNNARPLLLGLFQASSALGNVTAAFISMGLGSMQEHGSLAGWTLPAFDHHSMVFDTVRLVPWRIMFLIGVIPGLLVVLIQMWLREPERWLQARASGGLKKAGSYAELLGDPLWRKHALLGLLLALSGVIGLWGIGFFSPDLQQYVAEPQYRKQAEELVEKKQAEARQAGKQFSDEEAKDFTKKYVNGQKAYWAGITSLMVNAGAFFGIFAFSYVTVVLGRRLAFGFFFLTAGAATAVVFMFLREWSDILWMVPMMGFFQLALFGGYAIYFPELFPTRLRSTGTSFCYNVGRLIAAVGPFAMGKLTSVVFAHLPAPEPLRYAGLTMCSIFLVGLLVLPFLPETKGKPLPE